MIRILHVIGKMGCGGAETMLMNLYRNIDRTQIQFDFMVHTEERQFYDDEIESLGGRIYRTERFNVRNYFAYKKFWDGFFDEHAEYPIVHGHIGSCAAIYLFCAKKHGRIAIAHSHSNGEKKITFGKILRWPFIYPTRYIANYFFACSRLAGINRYGKKVSESMSFRVLNNGIDPKKFAFDMAMRETMRTQCNISENQLVVGHVGRYTYAKNHDFLIDIFEAIVKKVPDAQLWLVGDGELKEAISAKLRKKNLERNVRMVGLIDKVNNYLQAMDVFIFPSFYEGVSLALVEAQAACLPCVASDDSIAEADIGVGLIYPMHLKDTPEEWACCALNVVGNERTDMSAHVSSAGYDIADTALALQDYYIGLIRKEK